MLHKYLRNTTRLAGTPCLLPLQPCLSLPESSFSPVFKNTTSGKHSLRRPSRSSVRSTMSRVVPESTSTNLEKSTVHYPCKWVMNESGCSVPICMQGRNGPCALLALFNISLQTCMIRLEPGTTKLAEDVIMTMLADAVSTPQTPVDEPTALLRAHAVSDFLDLLPCLTKGMDINVRFSQPTAFEFTRELSVFDIFPNVRLLHGWLVDPQDRLLAEALGTLSYNQVIDELVRTTSPAPPPEAAAPIAALDDAQPFEPSAPPVEAFEPTDEPEPPLHPDESAYTARIRDIRPFVMDFLQNNPTQLTVYGLAELHHVLREGETAILFRNSHFHVLKKFKGELFTLVTDVGYLNELDAVWEKLGDINGDSTFYTGAFQQLSARGVAAQPSTATSRSDRQASIRGHASGRPGCASQHALGQYGHPGSQAMQHAGSGPSRKASASKRKSSKTQECVVQ